MNPRDMTDDQLNRELGATIAAERKAKKNAEELKREWFKRHGKDVGTEVDGGGVTVILQRNHRFNEDLARQVLTPEQQEAITKTALDSKKAKELLPAEVYEQCMKDGNAPKFGVSVSMF